MQVNHQDTFDSCSKDFIMRKKNNFAKLVKNIFGFIFFLPCIDSTTGWSSKLILDQIRT